jgi:hypothetical protein
VFDGAPSAKLYGSDMRPEYFELGYELFQDKDTFKATFISADVFDELSALTGLAGQIDMIYTGSFFHLFDYERQVQVAKRAVQLLKPQAGSLIIGRHIGSESSGEVISQRPNSGEVTSKHPRGKFKRFNHNEESWAALWKKVGEETGTRWKVEATLSQWMNSREKSEAEKWMAKWRGEQGVMRLSFVVGRL